jgi:hypothetical protein
MSAIEGLSLMFRPASITQILDVLSSSNVEPDNKGEVREGAASGDRTFRNYGSTPKMRAPEPLLGHNRQVHV